MSKRKPIPTQRITPTVNQRFKGGAISQMSKENFKKKDVMGNDFNGSQIR